jgi:uncharacterized protein (TIGR03790 family)
MLMKAPGSILLYLALGARSLAAADSGDAVVLIYNSSMAESREVARHYAALRHVPARQIIGLDLPAGETMTRTEYRNQLEGPLLDFLQRQTLLVYAADDRKGSTGPMNPVEAKVRYAVLCFGVPLRIAEDPFLREPAADKIPEDQRRNGAAVDSELSLLPARDPSRLLAGTFLNPLFRATNRLELNPTNGLLMVARLDGPTAAIAEQLVDKAMDAETNGLWGRAYFDLRGLTAGSYKLGDDWIGAAAEISRRYGFDTVVDNQPETFSAGFPMSQIALYAGWYDGGVSGPFTQPRVEFMPGAFAYHLHSFSAHTLRSTNQNWCGPLLAEGAAATLGYVDEPYLEGTVNLAVFFAAWVPGGFSFGEAAYLSQRVLSWQTTVIGDPLYQPFGHDPRALHEALYRRHSPLIEWSHLRVVNLNLVHGVAPGELVPYLLDQDETRHSAVLTEKLAELYQLHGEFDRSIEACRQALKLDPTPQQHVRLILSLGEKLAAAGRKSDALSLYDDFLERNPDYPDALAVYKKLNALATELHRTSEAETYARRIEDLSPPPPK